MEMQILACALLLIFLNMASYDGLYLHLYKYKLHARKESQKEHLLHSINAFIFPWSIFFIFLYEFKGYYLWFGLALTVISLTIEFLDVFEERRSRMDLGGLTTFEYACHMAMGSLRASYTTLILMTRPASDWLLSSESNFQFFQFAWMKFFIYSIVLCSLAIGFLHVYLIFHGFRTLSHASMANSSPATGARP